MSAIRDFLAALERELPFRRERRRRILAEVEDHLLEAARLHGPEQALLAYPVVESALPAAPWPSAAEMPGQLAWKQDAVLVPFLSGFGAALIGGVLLARGRRGLAPVLVVLAPLGVMSVLGLILAVQWRAEAPGTPAWLLAVPLAQVGLAGAAALLLARAFGFAARPAESAPVP